MKQHAPVYFFVFFSIVLFGVSAFSRFYSKPIQAEALADKSGLDSLIRGELAPIPTFESTGIFHGKGVTPPVASSFTPISEVLGLTNAKEKRIEVDLTNQKTYAYEGNRLIYTFIVSTGLWGYTPTGEFTIWTKVRSQLMQGGSKELQTYYYLPNVPYVMFFYNTEIEKMRGYSFHGAYWHNNFGHPMSHGCINMKNDDAKLLYEWANPMVTNAKAWSTPATKEDPGTKVIIYGKAPLY